MKHSLKTCGLALFLASASAVGWTAPAQAGNSSVEATMESLGDVSMFYQALLNTGVINELREDQHYTIFAPVNAAFAQIPPRSYPCFYAVQCRPQIAALMRDHIILGRHDERDLVTYGFGIQTLGKRPVLAEEPFVGHYTVDGKTILSASEADGNIVYRIDGVIALPQELSQFQTVSYAPTVTTRKTITTYGPAYPAGTIAAPPVSPGSATETTTVIHTYTDEPY